MKKFFLLTAAILSAIVVSATEKTHPGNKKVLLIMLDGVRADAVQHIAMPTLTALKNGTWQRDYKCAYTDAGMVVQDAPPHSAPNHASIATGVKAAKHKVSRNGKTSGGNYKEYPHFLGHLQNKFPDMKCGFFYVWGESGDIKSNNDKVIYKKGSDNATVNSACEFLKTGDAAAVYINQPDYYGHMARFYPRNLSYMHGLAACDNYLKKLFSTIASRPDFAKEDWLILVTADHGGYLIYHGGLPNSGNMTTIPMFVAGKNVKPGMIKGTAYTYDMAVTALEHFGVDTSKLSLDGRALGKEVQVIDTRSLKDGLCFYYDFTKKDAGFDNKTVIREKLSGFDHSVTLKRGHCKLSGSEKIALENGNNFTLTFWAKIPQRGGKDSIIISNKNMRKNASPGVAVIASRIGDQQRKDTPGICLSIGTKDGKNIELGQFDRTDDWNFFAVTVNANGTLYFCNGAESGYFYHMAYDGSKVDIASDLAFFIGQDGTGKHPISFSGEIDDVAFWNRGMSRADLQKIFEAGRKGIDLNMLLQDQK